VGPHWVSAQSWYKVRTYDLINSPFKISQFKTIKISKFEIMKKNILFTDKIY
jgi:hypothetical protein